MSSEEAWVEKMTLEEIKAAAEKNMKPEVWDWVNGATETGRLRSNVIGGRSKGYVSN